MKKVIWNQDHNYEMFKFCCFLANTFEKITHKIRLWSCYTMRHLHSVSDLCALWAYALSFDLFLLFYTIYWFAKIFWPIYNIAVHDIVCFTHSFSFLQFHCYIICYSFNPILTVGTKKTQYIQWVCWYIFAASFIFRQFLFWIDRREDRSTAD